MREPEFARRTVSINGRRYILVKELGRGSFGTVYSAFDEANMPVAVKEVLCKSEAECKQALNEFAVMDKLKSGSLRYPRYHASECRQTASKSWTVVCAMERRAGDPLDMTNVCGLSSSDACALTRRMVKQLLPTLCRVARTAVHRDINSHNILLDTMGGDIATANFTLIDFGLAVDLTEWQRGKWRELGVSGDARYWPPAAWMMFCGELSRSRRIYVDHYIHMLDVHAFGLTAVEFLVEVMDPCSPMAKILWPAWQAYWRYAVEHWQLIHSAFKTHAADSEIWTTVRAEYIRKMVAQNIEARLNDIRRALQLVARDSQYSTLLLTLARMLATKPICWAEVANMFAEPEPLDRAEKSHMRNVTSSTAPTEGESRTPTPSRVPADGSEMRTAKKGQPRASDIPRVPPQGRAGYSRARSNSVRLLTS
jgi:hypothetical protein